MLDQVIIAGSGGQGIQFAGQLLARAAMRQGLQATYVPTYGAERRGGQSFCYVAISDGPIYSPQFDRPDVLLAFDQRARLQYGATVKPGGTLLVNSDLAPQSAPNESGRAILLPASTLADQVCQGGGLNLVLVGAYLAFSGRVRMDMVQEVLTRDLTKKPEWLESNLAAVRLGAQQVQEGKNR